MVNRRKLLIIAVVVGLIHLAQDTHAQKMSASLNLLGLANMGTLDAGVSYGLSRHLTATAGFRYNPFTFNNRKTGYPMQNRQLSGMVGVSYWPWHIHSGWWGECHLRYQEYNIGGFRSLLTREGEKVGLGLSLGYCHMLSEHFNVIVGSGVWAGYDFYKCYSCPRCGNILEDGKTTFSCLDDVVLSVCYVF